MLRCVRLEDWREKRQMSIAINRPLVQWIEYFPAKEVVEGPIPSWPAKYESVGCFNRVRRDVPGQRLDPAIDSICGCSSKDEQHASNVKECRFDPYHPRQG